MDVVVYSEFTGIKDLNLETRSRERTLGVYNKRQTNGP